MRRTILTVLALALLLGCEADSVTQTGTETTEGTNTAQPATTATTSLPTTTRPTDYPMGATLTTEPGGHKLTVYSYKAPVSPPDRFTQPRTGFVFAAIEVQQCAGSSGDKFGPNRFDWELAMPDNSRIRAGLTVVEPQLGSSPLGPGDCIRGFVSFEVPSGATPRHVVYNEVSSGAAKWRVA